MTCFCVIIGVVFEVLVVVVLCRVAYSLSDSCIVSARAKNK